MCTHFRGDCQVPRAGGGDQSEDETAWKRGSHSLFNDGNGFTGEADHINRRAFKRSLTRFQFRELQETLNDDFQPVARLVNGQQTLVSFLANQAVFMA